MVTKIYLFAEVKTDIVRHSYLETVEKKNKQQKDELLDRWLAAVSLNL